MPLLEDLQSLDDLDLENQVVFVRVDLELTTFKGGGGGAPFDLNLRQAARTIETLRERGARIVVGSRYGEKKSGTQKKESAPSIEPAVQKLCEFLDCDVLLPDSCVGDSVKRVLMELNNSRICVLENLAQSDDRGPGSEAFARKLAESLDVYVGNSVKLLEAESATTTELPRLVEHRAASPALMRELAAVDRINSGIDGPRLVIWRGNSLSSRLSVLDRLAEPAEKVFLVGVAANTMLRAQGGAVGRSAVEESYLAGARTLAEKLGQKLVLPSDLVCAESIKSNEGSIHPADQIPEQLSALDLGPESRNHLSQLIEKSRTAIWCGTVGFHKSESFAHGTRALINSLASASGFTMVAGEDSVAATHAVHPDSVDDLDCVALGGSATLSLFSDSKLPGLEALRGITHEQTNPSDSR